jgi:siroheme synthase
MGLSHLISIVGAGPGDPELLTVKAMNRLKNAQVVLYDALIGEEVLKMAPAEAVKLYFGKLHMMMVRILKNGRTISITNFFTGPGRTSRLSA